MIEIFNNSNTVQPVSIRDRDGKFYTIFIESKKSTLIEDHQVSNDLIQKINSGLIKDRTGFLTKKDEPTATNPSVVISPIKVVSEEITQEESAEVPKVVDENIELAGKPSSIFKCDICGNEFATEKGLTMHKSRSHK